MQRVAVVEMDQSNVTVYACQTLGCVGDQGMRDVTRVAPPKLIGAEKGPVQ
jgi:hypothetical protein